MVRGLVLLLAAVGGRASNEGREVGEGRIGVGTVFAEALAMVVAEMGIKLPLLRAVEGEGVGIVMVVVAVLGVADADEDGFEVGVEALVTIIGAV